MRCRIRINCFALSVLFTLSAFSAFAQVRPEPLPPLDSLDFAEMGRISVELFGTAQGLEGVLKTQEPDLNQTQSLAVEQWTTAKQDSTAAKTQVDSLSKVAKMAKDNYKKLSNQIAKAGKTTQFALSVVGMDSLNMRKNLPKSWKQVSQLFEELYPAPPMAQDSSMAQAPKPKKEKKKKETIADPEPGTAIEPGATPPTPSVPVASASKKFAAYNPATDVMLQPPTPPCVIASNSRDEFSGEISREMSRAELFRYTNPALKNYLQGKTHVICEAALASAGPNNSLLLTFTINDPNARKAFGRLDKNSIANLKFMDEVVFTLQNTVPDDGVFNPETGATIFRAQYPLTPEMVKKMRRTPLDKLRIAWSNGYDDYEVQQVDLLMRQAECLSK